MRGRAIVALLLVACADENDPKTWIERLAQPARRDSAIEWLERSVCDLAR